MASPKTPPTLPSRSHSPPLPVQDPRKAILENGHFSVKDELLGQRLKQMNDERTAFASVNGLEFCKLNVLENPKIRTVLDSFLDQFSLGLYRSIGASNGEYTFRNDPNSGVVVLIVQLWCKGSEVIYWNSSHQHSLQPIGWPNSLLRVRRSRLNQLGLQPTKMTFEHGGFSIIDARIAFETLKGTAITFAFGSKDATKSWRPMTLPKKQDVEQLVANMEGSNFRMNVTYIEEPVSHN